MKLKKKKKIKKVDIKSRRGNDQIMRGGGISAGG
jgi:hypothetical protein